MCDLATIDLLLISCIMDVDRVGWRDEHMLQIPATIQLLSQSASRPELKPAEYLWDYPHESYVHTWTAATLNR